MLDTQIKGNSEYFYVFGFCMLSKFPNRAFEMSFLRSTIFSKRNNKTPELTFFLCLSLPGFVSPFPRNENPYFCFVNISRFRICPQLVFSCSILRFRVSTLHSRMNFWSSNGGIIIWTTPLSLRK